VNGPKKNGKNNIVLDLAKAIAKQLSPMRHFKISIRHSPFINI